MESKIKFVRYYEQYGYKAWDIVYKSGRVRTIILDQENSLPYSVQLFVILAKNKIEQFDKLFNRKEIIYS